MPGKSKITSADNGSVFFVGLDVAMRECWFAPQSGKRRKCSFAAEDVAELCAGLRKLAGPQRTIRCVMEHTGVYSMAWTALLEAEGMQCSLLNPARVRYHAQSTGQRSKTDRADCAAVLEAALQWQPEARTPLTPAQARLAVLQSQLRFLKKQQRALGNRLHMLSFVGDAAEMQQLMSGLLDNIEEAIASTQAAIQQTIRGDREMARDYDLLLSIPGLGAHTAAELLVHQDKLHSLSASQLTAFSGLAPMHKQSGSSVRGRSRIDKQGNAAMRGALYMTSLSARFNPRLKEVRDRLKAQGKHSKVILVALARHMLRIARSVVVSGKPFFYEPLNA